MTYIKTCLIDIAYVSHHVNYLAKATAANKPLRGLTAEPQMMLVDTDSETKSEWKEQTKTTRLATWKWPNTTTKR